MRKRNEHEEKTDVEESSEVSDGLIVKAEGKPPERKPRGKTRLTYDGPADQGVIGFPGSPEPGQTYEIPDELAESLLASSLHWKKEA